MWGSLLTIADLSILSGMYVHAACTFDHVFSSVFLPKKFQRQSFKVHPKEVLAYDISSKQAAKIAACREPDRGGVWHLCRFVVPLFCLSFLKMSLFRILINTVLFCILAMVSEFLSIITAFIFSASYLLNLIGWSIGWHEMQEINFSYNTVFLVLMLTVRTSNLTVGFL